MTPEDLLPISALQHWAFCPRQCALIHVDQAWSENARTASGRVLHQRTHERGSEIRDGVRIARSLRLASRELGLTGVADVVEFHPAAPDSPGAALPNTPGRWVPFPVEYKRGKPKANDCDRIQLCAQAMCIEEMLGADVPEGALYYGRQKRRSPVGFTCELRAATVHAAERVREMLADQALPPPSYGRKCKACSMSHICLPRQARPKRATVDTYVRRMIASCLDDVATEPSDEDP